MTNTEIVAAAASAIVTPDDQLPGQVPPKVEQTLSQMVQLMASMADMIRATNAHVAQLEHQVRQLTKVTPAQATAINGAIRARAAELCAMHRAAGCEKQISNAIRKDIKLQSGAQSVRELPRCEYTVTMQQVAMWDDYKAIRAIKRKKEVRI